MEIKQVDHLNESDVAHCDFSFDVASIITPPFDNSLNRPSELRMAPLQPYQKAYGFSEDDFDDCDGETKYLAVVIIEDRIQGFILASESWNGVASIDDIALDRRFRGQGIAKQLLAKVTEWAVKQGIPALRAETQSNNVQACHLYRACGFRFGGYDEYLYCAIAEHKTETALFWYLLLA